MKIKSVTAAVATLSLMLTMGVSAAAAGSSSSSSAASSSGSTSSSSSTANCPEKHGHRCHGDGGAMQILSSITGENIDSLTTKYPQKTAWQIAKKLNKLDQLKKEYVAKNKTLMESLVSAGRISAEDSAKMLADLQKRVDAIDGVNTVILGRPAYRPQMNKSQAKAAG